MNRFLLIVVSLLTTACSPLLAQELPQAGPETKALEKFVGQWKCEIGGPGGEASTGTSRYKMELNGMHLSQELTADLGGFTFQGHGTTSYCPFRKKYVSTWIDTMSSSPTTMEGTMSEDKKQLTEKGQGPGMNGLADYKSTTRWQDDDTFVFTLYVMSDGNEQELMSITYQRQK